MKLLISVFILLIYTITPVKELMGQNYSSNKTAQNAYKKAEYFLNTHKKNEAIAQLTIAIENDSTFVFAMQQLADLYRLEKKFTKAIPLYKKVLVLNPKLTTLTYFGLGESLLCQGQYQAALIYLNQYSKEKISDKGLRLTKKYIQDCEFALQQNLSHNPFLQRLPNQINSIDNEYFPKLTADSRKIIFTRKFNNQENFYESYFSDNQWSDAKKIRGEINSDDFNEGAHCISPDGKHLFFTGCNRPEGIGSCDIYISKLENGIWTTPRNLGKSINTKHWESQPAISADGRTLYFTSNRPGGLGGYDIWKSNLLEDGNWTEPINLGKSINTSYDEGSPFIHADNKSLYFSSNGWPGFGQQDLFLSTLDDYGNWTIPINLGYPINNNYPQNSIQITLDGNTGFLSSQDSTDQLDIYRFTTPEYIKPTPIAFIMGTIVDKDLKNPLRAEISITNTHTKEIVFKISSDEEDGSFLATLPIGSNYAFHIQKPNYLFYSEQYNLQPEEIKDKEFHKKIFLQSIKTGNLIQLNNLYFDIDKYEILDDSHTELQVLVQFLKTNPNIRIEISGHTDNSGTISKNKILSENRAKSVHKYLFNQGIQSQRMTVVGYGHNQPIADNSTPEGRKLNRRTEIKIL